MSPAACSWSSTRPMAAASTGPGAWRCASASAALSISSCRPPPPRTRSFSRWPPATASPWTRCGATCIPARPSRCWCRRCSTRRCSACAGAGTPPPRWPCRASPADARWRRRCNACAAKTCWPRCSPTRWPAWRTSPANARFPITRWWRRPSTIACTKPWTAKAGSTCCGAWSAARSPCWRATCRHPRRWRRRCCPPARTPSSTMRRWRSAAPRPCRAAAGPTPKAPTISARWMPKPSRRCAPRPGRKPATPTRCTRR